MSVLSSVLTRAHTGLLYVGGAYLAFLLAITVPSVQRSLIYLHHIRFPWHADFQRPETFGFSPGKVLPLTLTTPDGATLGAWLCLPDDVYDAWVIENGIPESGPLPEEVFERALRSEKHPTVLYQHGNAATRAAANRVNVARHMTASGFNFLIYDYRGFGDSSSTPPPSERGLVADARAAWDFLSLAKGVPASRIAVMGQSLGTGVTAGLVATLAEEGITPRTVILVAPFSSIPSLLETYRLGNLVPILAPFRSVPWAMDLFLRVLHTRFDTKSIIHKIACPILILHALNDDVIPFSHSSTLFTHLLSLHPEADDISLVKEVNAGGWGVVRRFAREGVHGDVVWAEAGKGAHNEIGTSEMSIRLIRDAVRQAA